jgi:hypothetical protein
LGNAFVRSGGIKNVSTSVLQVTGFSPVAFTSIPPPSRQRSALLLAPRFSAQGEGTRPNLFELQMIVVSFLS